MAGGIDNDVRGWIMAGVSGVACIFGACIICVDFLVRLLPGKEDFSIQNSDTFLSSSLSLSFGVMLFSALYSMLPHSKISLEKGGFSASAASWILIGCFLGGVIGIQILSRLFHHFMPSHVVGCEHTHDDEEEARGLLNESLTESGNFDEDRAYPRVSTLANATNNVINGAGSSKGDGEIDPLVGPTTLPRRLTSRMSSFLKGTKPVCDAHGPCRGFSDPCGKECFRIIKRTSLSGRGASGYGSIAQGELPMPGYGQSRADSTAPEAPGGSTSALLHHHGNNNDFDRNNEQVGSDGSSSTSTAASSHQHHSKHGHHRHTHGHEKGKQHHHHVPSNAFLSIGLQTSFAIALHKLPEGFITYATNHANPELGFAIFVALFIHNITEGFALALPLFLAINSRWKAIVVSAVLGGASQPLGAGIAALWFRLAGPQGVSTSDSVYGCMFAVTSGIMTSVALQLFSESLGLTHSKTLCIIWAFVGMGILGCSSALTA